MSGEPVIRPRPTKHEYLMELAVVASRRTTCLRRGVGCVLADERGHVLAIGYNGVARGLPHCNQQVPSTGEFPYACGGHDLPSGQDACEAVHAEQNALLQCADPDRIRTAYVTLSPCKACLKLLLNTPCERVIFLEEHTDPLPRSLWTKAGRRWERLILAGARA